MGSMLTISQLAAYAGVTVRAVRYHHRVGLLAEPERDHSGYRVYGAGDVVRLIRIRTLAEAGVPLARVRELLDADPETFAAALDEIDRRLRVQIRALQQHRRQIRLLESSETLALPAEVTDYLARQRDAGAAGRPGARRGLRAAGGRVRRGRAPGRRPVARQVGRAGLERVDPRQEAFSPNPGQGGGSADGGQLSDSMSTSCLRAAALMRSRIRSTSGPVYFAAFAFLLM